MTFQQHHRLYAKIKNKVENAVHGSVGQGFTCLTLWSSTKYHAKLPLQLAINFYHEQFQKQIHQEFIIIHGLKKYEFKKN